MASLIPQLVRDTETGKICALLKMGSEIAVHELPDYLAASSGEEIKRYLESVVPEMMGELKAKVHKKRRTLWNKAKD